MENRQNTPEMEQKAPMERLEFDGFAFPVLPSIEYQTDGPDKAHPDRLFVRDRQDRFMFYFEKGFEQLPDVSADGDYETVEVVHKGRKLLLWYPEQRSGRKKEMGYFNLKFLDGRPHKPCCGQLLISRPGAYFTGLREIPELYTLLAGIEVLPGEGEAP